MNERRRYARFSNKSVVCKLGSDHQLLNISMGGLLIKRNEDDTDQVLGHQAKCCHKVHGPFCRTGRFFERPEGKPAGRGCSMRKTRRPRTGCLVLF